MAPGKRHIFRGMAVHYKALEPLPFSSLRMPDVGMDFGIGSDELKVENPALLISMLEDDNESAGSFC